jgi:Flp pilus assembly protein TadG
MTIPRRSRRGSQAVEFALVLPVLLTLTAGIVDYGWYYSTELTVIHAVREGARAGAAAEEDDDACTIATNATVEALNASGFTSATAGNVDVAVVDAPTIGTGGLTITVTVSMPYNELWGLVTTPTNMIASMTMRMEEEDVATCT